MADNPLHGAAMAANSDLVRRLLDQGADLSTRQGPKSRTVLIDGAFGGSPEVVQMLLDAGVPPDDQDAEGWTALMVAIHQYPTDMMPAINYAQIIGILIAAGADVNLPTANGQTALILAAGLGLPDICNMLIQAGADPLAAKRDGFNALMAAAQGNLTNLIGHLLDLGVDVNYRDMDGAGWSALMVAVDYERVEATRLLLERGADPNQVEAKTNETALSLAIKRKNDQLQKLLIDHGALTAQQLIPQLIAAIDLGQKEKVRDLIESGADPNERDSQKWTAIMIAIYRDDRETLRLLIEKGADVNLATDNNQTSLHLAAAYGKSDMASMLLDAGADPKAARSDGYNALMAAAQGNLVELAGRLLDLGIDVNAADASGMTALWFTVEKGHAETARLLLDRGAYIDAPVDGRTPLMKATDDALALLLIEKGANVNSVDAAGTPLITYHAADGRLPVVKALVEKGADVDAQKKDDSQPNYNGMTALLAALSYGHRETADYLVSKGASLKAQRKDGYNLLHAIAQGGVPEYVGPLLEAGLQINAVDSFGSTALIYAAEQGYSELVDLLLEKGADKGIKDVDGLTAASWARKGGHDDLAARLAE